MRRSLSCWWVLVWWRQDMEIWQILAEDALRGFWRKRLLLEAFMRSVSPDMWAGHLGLGFILLFWLSDLFYTYLRGKLFCKQFVLRGISSILYWQSGHRKHTGVKIVPFCDGFSQDECYLLWGRQSVRKEFLDLHHLLSHLAKAIYGQQQCWPHCKVTATGLHLIFGGAQ